MSKFLGGVAFGAFATIIALVVGGVLDVGFLVGGSVTQPDARSPGADVGTEGQTGPTEPEETAEGSGPTTAMTSSVSQFGLTVEFDAEYPVGQFVNGDFFVVGSPTVVALSPEWDGTMHGAEINPIDGQSQGYHAEASGYRGERNVAEQLPYQLEPGDSLIHTRGWMAEEAEPVVGTNNIVEGVPRPAVTDAMVLTVLDEPAPEGSFRPHYTGVAPKTLYNAEDLRWDLLPNLPVPAGAEPPSWETLEGYVDRPWIDQMGYHNGRYIQPRNNMSQYGRDIAREGNEVILKLLLDYPREEKKRAMVGIVQVGIDLHGAALQATLDTYAPPGGYWAGDWGGGLGIGRKWPVLFAGIMLADHGGMRDIGERLDPSFWQEDGQTYYSTGGDNPRPEGEPSWGSRAYTRGETEWGSYRRCCTATTWYGAALGALMMEARDLWNWEPFFDYTDWYVENDADALHSEKFMLELWRAYREDY